VCVWKRDRIKHIMYIWKATKTRKKKGIYLAKCSVDFFFLLFEKLQYKHFEPSGSFHSVQLFIYFALSFGKWCTSIMKSKYFTLYCQTKFIRFMCQWRGHGPHTESFLSWKDFSWNIKYGKWGDPLLPENRICSLLKAPMGLEELKDRLY
jgi:hypothetical protein